jgi:hypothetical protein
MISRKPSLWRCLLTSPLEPIEGLLLPREGTTFGRVQWRAALPSCPHLPTCGHRLAHERAPARRVGLGRNDGMLVRLERAKTMSEKDKQKLAIILRGPPSIGKSSVTKLLKAKLFASSVKDIDLDDGWGTHQNRRYPPGDGRYADLKTPEDVLIIELGCGEPAGESFKGATKNPREWVAILEGEGRQVHAFLLWTDYETWKKRLLTKVPGGDPGAHAFYTLFERDEWKQFPAKAGIREESIDTTTVDQQQVANRIWAQVQESLAVNTAHGHA